MAKVISILVVDDSPLICKSLHRDLTEKGAEVREARSVASAKKQVSESPPIDLFLIDYNLPGSNGLEFLTWLRQQDSYARTPAMFLTTQRKPDELAPDALGIRAWLVKPVSIDNLWLAIQTIVDIE